VLLGQASTTVEAEIGNSAVEPGSGGRLVWKLHGGRVVFSSNTLDVAASQQAVEKSIEQSNLQVSNALEPCHFVHHQHLLRHGDQYAAPTVRHMRFSLPKQSLLAQPSQDMEGHAGPIIGCN
jgi:hypothetical protein